MAFCENSDLQQHTYTKKLSLTTASLSALYMLPLATQAGIVNVVEPFSIDTFSTVSGSVSTIDWDVDGNSVVDFRLEAFRRVFSDSQGSITAASGNVFLSSAGFAGQGVLGASNINSPPTDISPASTTFAYDQPIQVGPDQNWFVDVKRVLVNTSSTNQTPPFWDNVFSGPMIGFRFLDDADQILYGWARLNPNDLQAGIVTIEQWAYEDSGKSITAGQTSVPLPPTFFSMLSGLALGAGGVLRGRRQRKAKAEQDAKTVA